MNGGDPGGGRAVSDGNLIHRMPILEFWHNSRDAGSTWDVVRPTTVRQPMPVRPKWNLL